MIKVDNGVDDVTNVLAIGEPVTIIAEAAMVAAVVAQRVGALHPELTSDRVIDEIAKSAREIVEELLTEGVVQ